ncbi:MAG: hypothetical protein NC548_34060 [Lachnospiraceae bacterium]|nr:hypothetical protein [Lachnospiraceae bacterium]
MELISNAIQTVQPNQVVIFTDTAIRGSGCMVHRDDSGLVTLRGLTNGQCRARFKISFGANIAVPTGETVGPIYLVLAIDGEPVASTTMASAPAAVDAYNNVFGSVYVEIPKGCCEQISVKNTSTIPVNVSNANLIVTREA